MAARWCRCKRQGDDHRFDVRVVEQRVVAVGVDLDVLLGRAAIGPAFALVDFEQARPGGVRARRVPVAVERAVEAVGPDVGDGDDVDVVGIERADQHAAFVAGADDADASGSSIFSYSK